MGRVCQRVFGSFKLRDQFGTGGGVRIFGDGVARKGSFQMFCGFKNSVQVGEFIDGISFSGVVVQFDPRTCGD